jgi:two-component system, sensor histidine kinase and response regulator
LSKSEIKILLVDDREDNLLSMEVVLEKEGYALTRANSGVEALKALLKEEDFSLILMDVKMPGLNGYETAEMIYQREKLQGIPIIFITAHDHGADSEFEGYKAGAVDYIQKPFNPDLLKSKVAVFAELFRKNNLLKQQEKKLQVINADLMQLNKELEKRVKDRTFELENLNQELKELLIAKDRIMSVISHDLRNPVTALLVSSELLGNNIEQFNKDGIRQVSNVIHRTANNILSQLNELVDWAKKQRAKTNFSPTKLQLHKGTSESLELLKTNAAQKKVKLQNQISTDIYVKADLYMLRSIIQNLVGNAIKFTPEGGSVLVTARQFPKLVEVTVRDTGEGISIEKKHKLIKLLKAEQDISLKDGSTGLGLFLVKDFVAQHGGTLDLESEVGEGTTFRFTIPLD